MRHRASPRFWVQYEALPRNVRKQADKNYTLLKADHKHPSLHLKKIGALWSVRVSDQYRALGIDDEPDGIYWIWIGSHAEYDQIVRRR